jgi:FO synthase
MTYSRKVFIPLTRLCRDVCGYCTFATTPGRAGSAYLTPAEVLSIARAGRDAGCLEALFTLGDKPELRYEAARHALAALGYDTTVQYLAAMCELVLGETGLLPHINAGVMPEDEIAALRRVSVSQGIMLESASARLCEAGGPHFGSPDKRPEVRLEMIAAAGRLRVPFTSGILIGIGETRLDRVESLLALRDLHAEHGHLQEVIVQNFRAKPGTRMAGCSEPDLDDLMWTAAVARIILGPSANIQVPPNLSYSDYPKLLAAGISDWGGISPVTADHVNPEAPWPQVATLEAATAAAGMTLAQRLAVYPAYALDSASWQHNDMATRVLREIDTDGLARAGSWAVGLDQPPPRREPAKRRRSDGDLDAVIVRATRGDRLGEDEIVRLFSARGVGVDDICAAADELRRKVSGDVVRYVVNRNINYTNVCSYRCHFCAFSKGKTAQSLRGAAYDLSLDEIARRTEEAWERGATEVCMQGGINPHYTGETYLEIVRAVKRAVPGMHVHAFSPLEVTQGARTLGLTIARFLERLQEVGLGTLPGTAAEILDDEVRAIICPDKLNTREWIDVIETAHRIGLKTTATIMFGHVERPRAWARHLLHLRDLQSRSGGLTEFVPLPFVHMEAPIYLKGQARKGPTWRECLLMHAVARLVFHPLLRNVQASWVKLGPLGVAQVLEAGANDLGGTLMNESISRAAGTQHGQEFAPEQMEELIRSAGRIAQQRTTLYQAVDDAVRARSFAPAALADPVYTPFVRKGAALVQ